MLQFTSEVTTRRGKAKITVFDFKRNDDFLVRVTRDHTGMLFGVEQTSTGYINVTSKDCAEVMKHIPAIQVN